MIRILALVGLIFLFVGCSNNNDDDSKFDEDNKLVMGHRQQNEDGEWEIIPYIPADPH